jgi:hypothetical protein
MPIDDAFAWPAGLVGDADPTVSEGNATLARGAGAMGEAITGSENKKLANMNDNHITFRLSVFVNIP